MRSEKIIKTLKEIYAILSSIPLEKWTIFGSLSLYLRGIELSPHDIDILASRQFADKIFSLLTLSHNSKIIEKMKYSSDDLVRKYHGVVRVNDVDVEICADLRILYMNREVALYVENLSPFLDKFYLNDNKYVYMFSPCLSLVFYLLLKNDDKVKLILRVLPKDRKKIYGKIDKLEKIIDKKILNNIKLQLNVYL